MILSDNNLINSGFFSWKVMVGNYVSYFAFSSIWYSEACSCRFGWMTESKWLRLN